MINLDSRTDYRLEKLDRQPVYLTPLGSETTKRMDAAWTAHKNGVEEKPDVIHIKGREIPVRSAVPGLHGSPLTNFARSRLQHLTTLPSSHATRRCLSTMCLCSIIHVAMKPSALFC